MLSYDLRNYVLFSETAEYNTIRSERQGRTHYRYTRFVNLLMMRPWEYCGIDTWPISRRNSVVVHSMEVFHFRVRPGQITLLEVSGRLTSRLSNGVVDYWGDRPGVRQYPGSSNYGTPIMPGVRVYCPRHVMRLKS